MTVSADSPTLFEQALDRATLDMEEPQPLCATVDTDIYNPWIDWATNTEDREPHERRAPTKKDALDLCHGCELYNLCTDAAIVKPPYHGVRGAGLRYEFGRRLSDGRK